MAKCSVLLPTFNEETMIVNCLESVKWADEILVVDSYSTDHTLEIARSYGTRIIQHEYINSAKQKNWAVPQCKYEWIFQIDSDETLEAGTADELLAAIAGATADIQAFKMPRKNHFLGKWIQHAGMYPDYQTRLFRRDFGRWTEREVHAHVQVPQKVGTLSHCILHEGAPFITRPMRNLDRYTRYEADELKKNGKSFHWSRLIIHPWLVFWYRYGWLQGWRDGWRGFIVCVLSGVYSFFSYAKLWELEELGLDKSPK